MIQARLEDRRRAAVVLGGAEDDDRVHRALLVAVTLLPDAQCREPRHEGDGEAPGERQAHEIAASGTGQAP